MIDARRKQKPKAASAVRIPTILEIADRIAQKPGFDPPTPRWHATLAYLYGLPLSDTDVDELVAATHRSRDAIVEHARRTLGHRRFRQFWARIGRRGRKSATAALIAVYEAIWGGHEAYILPGEQALIAVISKDIAGANVITRFTRLYLDALGMRYSTTRIGAVSVIEIEGCQVGIAMLAATTDAPRGFAIPVLILDEIAHAATGDEYVDTDRSILAGAEPAMAQFPNALVIGISTGFGRDGVHYERVERGLGNDSEEEILAVTGASWEWSGDITEERAIAIADGNADILEAEFRGGLYENDAQWMPQADALAMFQTREERYLWRENFMLVDFAETGGDTLAGCVACFGDPDPKPQFKRLIPPPGSGLNEHDYIGLEKDEYGYPIQLPTAERSILWIHTVFGYETQDVRRLGMDRIVAEIAQTARENGVRQIIGDDRAGPYLEALFSREKVRFNFVPYANKKHEAVTLLRTWARDRQIVIWPEHAEFKKQALRYRRYISGNTFRYGKQGVRDDYVCLLVTLAVGLIRKSEEYTQHIPILDGAPTRKAIGGRYVADARY